MLFRRSLPWRDDADTGAAPDPRGDRAETVCKEGRGRAVEEVCSAGSSVAEEGSAVQRTAGQDVGLLVLPYGSPCQIGQYAYGDQPVDGEEYVIHTFAWLPVPRCGPEEARSLFASSAAPACGTPISARRHLDTQASFGPAEVPQRDIQGQGIPLSPPDWLWRLPDAQDGSSSSSSP